MAQVPERGVRDVRDSWGVEALFGGFDKPEQVHARLVIPPKVSPPLLVVAFRSRFPNLKFPPPATQVAQSNYGYGGGPNGGINPLELSWDEQRFLAQLASERVMVSDRARAHELSARASSGIRAGGVPSFVDVASPAKPVVARGVAASASAEFARPSSAVAWHERERTAARGASPIASSSPVASSSSSPARSTRLTRPSTAAPSSSSSRASGGTFGGPIPSASPIRPALKKKPRSSSSTARSSSQSPARRSVRWEPEVTESGIVESRAAVGNVPRVTTPTSSPAPSGPRRNLKFGGPGGGGGAPGGPRASWPGPRGGGVETLSYVKARIRGSSDGSSIDDARLSRDEREFLAAMASQRRMVSDRARLAASVAELGLLPRGAAPITTQPGSDVPTRNASTSSARPTGLGATGGPKQVSAVDYLHSGAPVAPVRASWNPDASPSLEDAAFNPARSLRESLERRRPRTATGVVGSTSRDENVNPNNPNPWVDRNAALRAAVRNRLRPSSARSQAASLGDLERLEKTVDALRRSYRRADPPARGRGGGGVGGGVGALDDAADAAARKIADREARDWEWQSSWQWEWQQELDVETRGARRAMEPPAPAQSPAKVHPSPEKRPAITTFERQTSSATSTPTKAAAAATASTPTKAAAATTTPVRTPPGARSAAKPPRSPAFVGSPALTAAARRSPFKEPIAAAPVAASTPAPAAASPEPEPKVKFGRRARGSGEGVEASRDPPTVPPSPPMPSPPTLTERSPPTERPGASSSYAERREAYRESRADRALSPFVAPAESVGGGDGGRARLSVPARRTAFDSDDLDDSDVGEDVETLPDELPSSGGEDSDIEVVELVEIEPRGAGGGDEEAMWRPASSKYV